MENNISEKILEKLELLTSLLDNKNLEKAQSDEIGILLGALSKAQGAYKRLIPNEVCASGKYANLEAILLAIRPAFADNALSFYQRIILLDEGSGAALLKTFIGHESGQFTSTTARVFVGRTDRATGNTTEIHKRLQAMLILGIAPTPGDPIAFDDNGGEQEEDVLVQTIVSGESKRNKVSDPSSVITKSQYNELIISLGEYDDIAKNIMITYKIETLADLPKEVYHDALAKIRRIRRTAEDYENRKK